MENIEDKKYIAFISYSHKDELVAKWLQKKIENYLIPFKIKFDGSINTIFGRRVGLVFRDRTDLPSGYPLTLEIEKALQNSKYLIVLCSPNSAKSEYVAKEISYFKSLYNGERIIPVILHGDSGEVFPLGLNERREILETDLRKDKDGKEYGFLKLISGILRVSPNELAGRERSKLRNLLLLSITTAAVFCLLAVVAFLNWDKTNELIAQQLLRNGWSSVENGKPIKAIKYGLLSQKFYSGSEVEAHELLFAAQHKMGKSVALISACTPFSLQFLDSDKYLAAICREGKISVFDTNNWQKIVEKDFDLNNFQITDENPILFSSQEHDLYVPTTNGKLVTVHLEPNVPIESTQLLNCRNVCEAKSNFRGDLLSLKDTQTEEIALVDLKNRVNHKINLKQFWQDTNKKLIEKCISDGAGRGCFTNFPYFDSWLSNQGNFLYFVTNSSKKHDELVKLDIESQKIVKSWVVPSDIYIDYFWDDGGLPFALVHDGVRSLIMTPLGNQFIFLPNEFDIIAENSSQMKKLFPYNNVFLSVGDKVSISKLENNWLPTLRQSYNFEKFKRKLFDASTYIQNTLIYTDSGFIPIAAISNKGDLLAVGQGNGSIMITDLNVVVSKRSPDVSQVSKQNDVHINDVTDRENFEFIGEDYVISTNNFIYHLEKNGRITVENKNGGSNSYVDTPCNKRQVKDSKFRLDTYSEKIYLLCKYGINDSEVFVIDKSLKQVIRKSIEVDKEVNSVNMVDSDLLLLGDGISIYLYDTKTNRKIGKIDANLETSSREISSNWNGILAGTGIRYLFSLGKSYYIIFSGDEFLFANIKTGRIIYRERSKLDMLGFNPPSPFWEQIWIEKMSRNGDYVQFTTKSRNLSSDLFESTDFEVYVGDYASNFQTIKQLSCKRYLGLEDVSFSKKEWSQDQLVNSILLGRKDNLCD